MAGNAVPFGTSSVADDLFLKYYIGKFNTAPQSSVFLYSGEVPGVFRKTVTEGKSWQFLMEAWDPAAEDFDPGNEMLGQSFEEAEGTITPDKYIVAHNMIPRDEMHRSHFEVLGRRAVQHRSTLSRLMDRRGFITMALAARDTALTGARTGATVHNGGNRVTRAGSSTTYATALATAYPRSSTGAANLVADIRQLARQLDEDNIPDGPQNRSLVMVPALRDVLLFDTTGQLFSTEYVVDNNNNRREVKTLAGFRVLGFPNTTSGQGPLPNENFTTGLSKYQANFTPGTGQGTPVVLAMCNTMDGAAAAGLVTFEDIKHEVVYIPEKLSYLVMSYTYAGWGKMHPWAAGSIELTNN